MSMNKVGLLRPYNPIGDEERDRAMRAMEGALSGYLGGELHGGPWVRHLEERWCQMFGSTHAIAVNSATSGLLAACHAVGVTNEEVIVSPYTMSATAAAPALLGADLKFIDIEPEHYCLSPSKVGSRLNRPTNDVAAIIATNLFGHPAHLKVLAQLAHANGAYLIEDNAQAPFAMEGGVYAGTVGDIGVFSLNVHKHIHAGEGGIVVTDNDDFALSIRHFINHGEMAGGPVGLNLRMTEVAAAIASAQLSRGKALVQYRVELAQMLIEGLKDNPMVKIIPPRTGCKHVYYALPMEVNGPRDAIIKALGERGVPLVGGYVEPLYWLPAFREFAPVGGCPVTEKLHKETLAYFEVCAYDPTYTQVKAIVDAFSRVAEEIQVDHAVQEQEAFTSAEGGA